MLLKVSMDFRSLKIRDTNHMHQHTHIGKKKTNNNNNNNKKQNNKTTIQHQGRTFGQVHAFVKNQKAITKLFQ